MSSASTEAKDPRSQTVPELPREKCFWLLSSLMNVNRV